MTETEIGHSFLDPNVMDDPFEAYGELHEKCPVYRMPETGLHLVTKYQDVREVLTSPEKFSNRPSSGAGRQTDVMAAHKQVFIDRGWVRASTLQRTDPPVHTRYRKLLNRVFTARRVKEMEASIDDVANELIDAFIDRGTCDFVEAFAFPLPGIVISEQLGLDRSQIKRFARWTEAMLALSQRVLTKEQAVAEAEIELDAQHFFADQIEARRAKPTDDLISALANTVDEDGQHLSMEELQDLMHQLITGGFETTTAALSAGVWHMIRFPDQWQMVKDDPSKLRAFVEESLRFDSPVQGLWRMTSCPVQLSGVEIAENQSVMPRYGAANRDADEFENPGTFDIGRENVNNHVAFGLGNHFCIGAALARQELMSAFGALLARLDDIALVAPLEPPVHVESFFLRPMKELPITFTKR